MWHPNFQSELHSLLDFNMDTRFVVAKKTSHLVDLCTKLDQSSPHVLKPCLQEIKARWNLSEWNPTLAHTSNENGGKTEASPGLVGGLLRTHWRILAQVCIPFFWGSHAGQGAHREYVLSTFAAVPPCRSSPAFTYLLTAMAVMTGPLTLRQPPRAPQSPFKQERKIFKSPRPGLMILTRVSVYSSCREHSGG